MRWKGRARRQAPPPSTVAHRGLLTAAERVRGAFADYAQLSVMRFPGPRSAWRAERADPRLRGDRWRLVQALPGAGGWILFGSVSGRPALLDARRGAGARGQACACACETPRGSPRRSSRGRSPAQLSRVFLASGRSPAARALLPAGAATGLLYAFPQAAMTALATLDPRETAQVELIYPAAGRERADAAPLEIGRPRRRPWPSWRFRRQRATPLSASR